MKTTLARFLGIGCLGWMIVQGQVNLPLRNLAEGAYSGISEARREVIKDLASWTRVWAEHVSRIIPPLDPPQVDFEKEMVLVTTMGTRSTGGYEIKINNVELGPEALRITVVNRFPLQNEIVTLALTAPFHFVAVNRTDLPPAFVDVYFIPLIVVPDPNSLHFSWADLGENYVYTLESKDSLSSTNWIPVAGWPWPARNNQCTILKPGSISCYYRIRAELGPPGLGW